MLKVIFLGDNGDNNGGARMTKPYPLTKHQTAFAEAADFCGIKKGVTKDEMKERMKGCIPEYWRMRKEGLSSSEIKAELKGRGFNGEG